MKNAAKFAIQFISYVFACLFFLSWAIQTVWIASFPGGDTQSAAIHFYLQLGAAVAFAFAAVWIVWKWLRYRKHQRNRNQAL